MRVSIIPADGIVIVEGAAEKVDLSSMDQSIHAVQWFTDVGEIEYFRDEKRRGNEAIDDFSPFQQFVDLWMIEAKKELKQQELSIAS